MATGDTLSDLTSNSSPAGTDYYQISKGNVDYKRPVSATLVNDLTTGGTAKSLTAEQGKELKELVDKREPHKFYHIDGDFQINQSGNSSVTAASGYVTDLWAVVETGGGSFTVNTTPEYDSDLPKNKIEFDLTSTNFYLRQRVFINDMLSEKTISYFCLISSTSGIADVETGVQLNYNGSTSALNLSSQFDIPASTSKIWYRFDVTVPSISGATINSNSHVVLQIRSNTNQTKDITFHKIRVIETGNLPGSEGAEGDTGVVIPDWVKENENYHDALNAVLPYFERLGYGSEQNASLATGMAEGAGNGRFTLHYTEKIILPTITGSSYSNIEIRYTGGTIAIASFSLAYITKTSALLALNTSGGVGLTAGQALILWTSAAGGYIDIDSRS